MKQLWNDYMVMTTSGVYVDGTTRFEQELIDIGYDDLECETKESGRKYLDPEGHSYPSITTVLKILSEEGIAAWRARVGEEEANRVSRVASTRGTQVHNILENYVSNKPYLEGELPHNIQTFKDIQPIIDANLQKVYAMEVPLYSKHLGIAGRVDLVGQWNGQESIIDWKTSKKLKKEEWVSGYYMQAAAYAVMWEERTGRPIKQLVVCIAGDEGPQVFISDRDVWIDKLKETIAEYKRRQMWPNQRK